MKRWLICLLALFLAAGLCLGSAEETAETGYSVGDIIMFGTYEQDNDPDNGCEPIEWIVLKTDADGLVLMSRYALDCVPYYPEFVDITWENSTLRAWLNDEFYNAAFAPQEQGRIRTVTVKNDDNPHYGTPGGNDTEDRVWLLSVNEVCDRYTGEEVYAYFTNDLSRMCAPTKYAAARGTYMDKDYKVDGVGSCWWTLRTPGHHGKIAAFVNIYGIVSPYGNYVHFDTGGVRPIICIAP